MYYFLSLPNLAFNNYGLGQVRQRDNYQKMKKDSIDRLNSRRKNGKISPYPGKFAKVNLLFPIAYNVLIYKRSSHPSNLFYIL